MRTPLAFLRFVAKAALNGVGFGVAGDFTIEFLPELARDVWDWWGKGQPAQQLRGEVQGVAGVGDDEAKRLAAQAVALEATGQPEVMKAAVAAYLTRVPAAVRASQRRPADLSGRTVAPGLPLARAEHLAALLPQATPRFQPGQQVPGFADWTLEELLGVGGFGEVWKAVNPPLPAVAVKFCLDAAAIRTLQNEKHLLGRVMKEGTHPGIVRLANTSLSGSPPCLMYEYVPGGDLTRLLHEWHCAPRPDLAGRVAQLMRQLAGIVAFAHQLSPPIVHRDLKPANVLLQTTPHGLVRLRVADFGIGGVASRQAERTRHSPTRGSFLATALRGSHSPLYASPEQMRGDDPDPRDDVHALGVIWYQLLTGDVSGGLTGDWREELNERAVPPRHIDLLGRCIASLKRRPADATVLVTVLDRLLGGEPVPATTTPPEAEPDDWVGQAVRMRQRQAQALEQARVMVDQHDYARAAQMLEELPDHMRDETLLVQARHQRDRVTLLKDEIRAAAGAGRLDLALAFRVRSLLELTPNDQDMRRLQAVLPPTEHQITNAVGMKLVAVQPGRFHMGSPDGEAQRQPNEWLHEVEITRAFYTSVWPVTQEQYQRIMGHNPSWFCATGGGKDRVQGLDTRHFPVESVSWEEAVAFCGRLSALTPERKAGRVYRLPTEAEWEYCCRDGGSSSLPFHVGAALASTQANFNGQHLDECVVPGPFLERTSAAGNYPANALGLHDMHGNVCEWCSDRFDRDYYRQSPRQDPQGPEHGEFRVLRGGAWNNYGPSCRAAFRNGGDPCVRSHNIGFRVVGVLVS